MFENQAFKSFEIEKIDDSRFSAQFAPVFEQEREDFNSENPDDFGSETEFGETENAPNPENEIIEEGETDKESGLQNISNKEISQNGNASNHIILADETIHLEEISEDKTANIEGTLSQIIKKAVDLGENETKAAANDQQANIFSRNGSESKFQAGSFKHNKNDQNDPTNAQNDEQPTRNQPTHHEPTKLLKSDLPKESIKESHAETIENSESFYPTESRGGEEHNVFQSEKRGETIEFKVGANGSEEDIKMQGEGNRGDAVRESGGILASAGSFGNGLTNQPQMVNWGQILSIYRYISKTLLRGQICRLF